MGQSGATEPCSWIDKIVSATDDAGLAESVAGEIRELCAKFPAPGINVGD